MDRGAVAIRCLECGTLYAVRRGVPVLHGSADATERFLEGASRKAHDRAQRRFRSIRTISSQPLVIDGLEGLEGLADAATAFERGEEPFFAWGLQRMTFLLKAEAETARFALTICSHQLHPRLRMTVTVDGAASEEYTLAYGWQRLIISMPTRVSKPAIAIEFDRIMELRELVEAHEAIPGVANMPEGTAARIHAIQRITPLELLQEELSASAIRAERSEWEIRRLAERQWRLEQLLPVRLYKRLRGMDW